jgi:hypothetical protein
MDTPIEDDNIYKPPVIIYPNYATWTATQMTAFQILFNGLTTLVLDEYTHLLSYGLYKITDCIIAALNVLTQNRNHEWATKCGWHIQNSIESMVKAFHNSGLYDVLHSLSTDKLTELLYKHIEWQIGTGANSPCILEDISTFRCKTCNNLYNVPNELDLCQECDENEIKVEYGSDIE